MDTAIRLIKTFFNDKLNKKVLKSSSTPSKRPKVMKQTAAPKGPQSAEERATIERLTSAKTLTKAPMRRSIDDNDTGKEGASEGKGEAIHLGTGGIPELVPHSVQHDHGRIYTGYDGGGGGDGGGGC